MPLIALTGGIASGKSTIAHGLEKHGAVIIDADQIVRDVQSPGSPVLQEIANAFGEDVIDASGALDRVALGARVFSDPEALARLNAIVHPAVRVESKRRMEAAIATDPEAVVVYDVPLLVEARADDPWDKIVVAHAPAELRLQRLIELRGMEPQAAQDRIDAQVADEERLAIADVVIDTGGTLEQTHAQVEVLWKQLEEK